MSTRVAANPGACNLSVFGFRRRVSKLKRTVLHRVRGAVGISNPDSALFEHRVPAYRLSPDPAGHRKSRRRKEITADSPTARRRKVGHHVISATGVRYEPASMNPGSVPEFLCRDQSDGNWRNSICLAVGRNGLPGHHHPATRDPAAGLRPTVNFRSTSQWHPAPDFPRVLERGLRCVHRGTSGRHGPSECPRGHPVGTGTNSNSWLTNPSRRAVITVENP